MRKLNCVVIAAALAGAAGAALGGLTTVNTGGTFGGAGGGVSDGQSIIRIMNQMLTGDTSIAAGDVTGSVTGTLNFDVLGAGGISVTRLQDFGVGGATDFGTSIGLATGGVGGTKTDQLWHDGTVSFTDRARYAGNAQYFGRRAGTSGGSGFSATTGLPLSIPSGFSTGSNTVTIGDSFDFRWMRANTADGLTNAQTSLAADNGGIDQMIAFEVFYASSGVRSYILAFEDMMGGGGDRDFNDLVIQLSVVPLPPAAWAGLSTLACVAGLGFIRRRKLCAA